MIYALVFMATQVYAYELPSGFKRNDRGDIEVGGTINVTNIVISSAPGATEVRFSTSGFTSNEEVVFASNVVIAGQLRVTSTKAKAIYLPSGGIHLSEDDSGNVPPGTMFAKKIQTSTITLIGSAMLWEDANGTIKATMTSTSLDIGEVKAKIKSGFNGGGVPANSDCDEATEHGTFYVSSTPGRLYICENPGGGWRYTTLSP